MSDKTSEQYLPSVEAIEWYRERFDRELAHLEKMADDYVDGEIKEGIKKAFRFIRYKLLRPVDGCVITMFDPRIRQLRGLVSENVWKEET